MGIVATTLNRWFGSGDPPPRQVPPPQPAPPNVQPQEVIRNQEIHVEQPPVDADIQVGQQPPIENGYEIIHQQAEQQAVPVNQVEQPKPRAEEMEQERSLSPKPVGTFQYLPDDYRKPNFEMTNNQDANKILTEVDRIFSKYVVSPRKEIDTTLRSFRAKAGKSPDAALTTCLEMWKSEAFPEAYLQDQKPAFKVRLNNAERVAKISPNEHEQFLSQEVNDITEEMNVLLDSCHDFLGERDDSVERLQEQIDKYDKLVKHNRSMKIDEAKREMESLIPELDRLVQQVDGLLTDIKAAVSNKDMVLAKPRTWQVSSHARVQQ